VNIGTFFLPQSAQRFTQSTQSFLTAKSARLIKSCSINRAKSQSCKENKLCGFATLREINYQSFVQSLRISVETFVNLCGKTHHKA